jgi:hypothetical protein
MIGGVAFVRSADSRESTSSRSSRAIPSGIGSPPASACAASAHRIGVDDLTGTGLDTEIDQLVAGRQQRDPRPAGDGHARDTERGQ